MRGLSSAIIAELETKQNRLILLVDGEFESGHLYLTNSPKSVIWEGNEYIALGHLLSVTGFEESLAMQTTDGNITLGGLNDSIKAIALEEEFSGNRVKVYFAFLDEDDNIIDEPFLPQEGLLNGMQMVDGVVS